ncbi:OsmC family protein [Psychromonas sp.]|nr:OsmC family protein [Psychromonas sp.]
MQALPHLYSVSAEGTTDSQLTSSSKGIPDITVAAPAEFGGPGDQWSPETLLLSAAANCFVLSFKAVSRASKLSWKSIHCESVGKLDRVDRITSFTEITTKVKLTIGDESEKERALKLLEKSESVCLISNSLNAKLFLECEIIVE